MTQTHRILNLTVVVSALGYFVDIYDLILFSIVRVPSLKALGVAPEHLLENGVFLLNSQMAGMLLGGILWGVYGDKKGRVAVLFGSILLYSIANILNALVTSVPAYGVLRFVAGVGLAGELGAAITLVSETLTKEKRGYGTAIVAGVGILGAVAAALIGDAFDWKVAYIVGGVMGLFLLVMRVRMFESGLFEAMKSGRSQLQKQGDFFMLFTSRARFFKYLSCILIGVPIWFVIGILVTFSPEISKELGITGPVVAGKAVMFCYIGLAIGDLASGFLSQWWRSRRKAAGLFLALTATATVVYSQFQGQSVPAFYALCAVLGFATGYWAVFVTIASEQFGTNLRATVTTTTPNFVRGSVVPLTLGFQALRGVGDGTGAGSLVGAAMVIGGVVLVLAAVALVAMPETYGKDLDYGER